jgi:hypothetical protein
MHVLSFVTDPLDLCSLALVPAHTLTLPDTRSSSCSAQRVRGGAAAAGVPDVGGGEQR